MRKLPSYAIPEALRSASHAAALLRGEGAGGNLTPEEAVPASIADLTSALHKLTQASMSVEIMVCGVCKGHGHQTHSELADYHKREYNVVRSDCHSCANTGRVVKTTLTWSAPFVPS